MSFYRLNYPYNFLLRCSACFSFVNVSYRLRFVGGYFIVGAFFGVV